MQRRERRTRIIFAEMREFSLYALALRLIFSFVFHFNRLLSRNSTMKKLLLNSCLTALALTLILTSCSTPDRGPRKILFFSRSQGFEHSVIKKQGDQPSLVETVLTDIGRKNNIEFTFSKDGTIFTPENIAKFDAFFFYTTGDLTEEGGDHNPPMSKEGKAAFLDAIHNGKGFIGTHAASDTFHSGSNRYINDGDNADPYIKMIGAEFIIHGSQQTSHMLCVDKNFPGFATFPSDFGPKEEWYSLKDFAPDLHVILVQDTTGMTGAPYDRPAYPETWAHLYGKGRVFYTSMGHREDMWANPVFLDALTGGINWAVHKVNADLTPNLDQVAPKASTLPPSK
jgi:uncharacterized protein